MAKKHHGIAVILNLGAKAAEDKSKQPKPMDEQSAPEPDTCPMCGQLPMKAQPKKFK